MKGGHMDSSDKSTFYYLRRKDNSPFATVCLIKYKDWYSRGMAICSLSDHFDKRVGKQVAEIRAKRGISILKTHERILQDENKKIKKIRTPFIGVDPIIRKEAWEAIGESAEGKNLPSLFKVKTLSYSDLTSFEKSIISRKGV
jgi:hypothetical protein